MRTTPVPIYIPYRHTNVYRYTPSGYVGARRGAGERQWTYDAKHVGILINDTQV